MKMVEEEQKKKMTKGNEGDIRMIEKWWRREGR